MALEFIHPGYDLSIFSSIQARLSEAHMRKGPFKSTLQQCSVKSPAVKRWGECKTISFCLPTKKWEKKMWCPSNSGHKSTFDSVPSRSVTPFSAVKNSLLVQIRGRRLLAACFLLQAGRQSDPTVDVMQAKYQNIWASVWFMLMAAGIAECLPVWQPWKSP